MDKQENKKSWRVLDGNMIYHGDKFVAITTNPRCAQDICDEANAETRTTRDVPSNETGDALIREVKRRTQLFVNDNYQNLSPSEYGAVSLIIENAMLIGGSIILEQDAQGSGILAPQKPVDARREPNPCPTATVEGGNKD